MAPEHITMAQRITTIPQYENHDKTFHLTLPRQSHHTSGFGPSFTPSRASPLVPRWIWKQHRTIVTPRFLSILHHAHPCLSTSNRDKLDYESHRCPLWLVVKNLNELFAQLIGGADISGERGCRLTAGAHKAVRERGRRERAATRSNGEGGTPLRRSATSRGVGVGARVAVAREGKEEEGERELTDVKTTTATARMGQHRGGDGSSTMTMRDRWGRRMKEIERRVVSGRSRRTLPFPFPASDSREITGAATFVYTSIFFVQSRLPSSVPPMEVTGKMPARVKRIQFVDSQNDCVVMLPQTVASSGQSSSMACGDDAQRKPKWRRRASLSGDGE
uniref:Uncharacterized protein n=1 Tax=Oryza brachyantha TaxID=4533 RepID=J3ND53_ORYBR